MAVVGCPAPVINHADVAAHFALSAQQSIVELQRSFEPTCDGISISIRAGLNSGKIRAGVVGMDSPRFKLFGDTVNTASRMESTCLPGRIQVSPSTKCRLSPGCFVLEDRGEISVKGKGTMNTAFIVGWGIDGTCSTAGGNFIGREVVIEYAGVGGCQPKLPASRRRRPSRCETDPGAAMAAIAELQGRRPSLSTDSSVSFPPALPSPSVGSLAAAGASLSQPTPQRSDRRFPSIPPPERSDLRHTSKVRFACDVESNETPSLCTSPSVPGVPHEKLRSAGNAESNEPFSLCTTLSLPGVPPEKSRRELLTPNHRSRRIDSDTEGSEGGIREVGRSPSGSNVGYEATPKASTPKSPFHLNAYAAAHILNAVIKRENWQSELNVGKPVNKEPTDSAIEPTSTFFTCDFRRLDSLFLLLPSSQKQPWLIDELRKDAPTYIADQHGARIIAARWLTTAWLLFVTLVSLIDNFLDVLDKDLPRYRVATLSRSFGNHCAGFVYMLLLSSSICSDGAQGQRFTQVLTVVMLLVQGAAAMVCVVSLYKSEPSIIVMLGAYILCHKVCSLGQRLFVGFFTIVVYVFLLSVFESFTSVLFAWRNIGFIAIFFAFMSGGVQLEEHLEHVVHYEQRRVKKRLSDIGEAKAAGSQLLNNLLPPHVVELVNAGMSPIAEHHSDVTIIFTDIKGYTAYASKLKPSELIEFLNQMYSAFDEIIVNWGLHKVEIIGDAYVIAAGCPVPRPEDQATADEYAMRAVEVALAMQRTMPAVVDDPLVKMRVGLHTGSVLAGVVGKKGPRYHLFGRDVSYAEKMESCGVPTRVHISDATHTLLTNGGHNYSFEERSIHLEGEETPHRTWLVNKSNVKAAFQIQRRLMAQRRQQLAPRPSEEKGPRRRRKSRPDLAETTPMG
eukprot:TRINITY_DN10355_c0_g1_i1.p1 TRINITY_DN10355_c0_g1~~TRINITY_DN10355_c0_g1_i1.p1  ORF type:complete len:962 (-),score=126.94 TRINITY_DN10355_c0_g1_i1:6-2705(-)